MHASTSFFIVCSLVLLCSCGSGGLADENISVTEPSTEANDTTSNNVLAKQEIAAVANHTNYLDFIPEGYSLLDSANGDLNLDPYQDMLLVLQNMVEDSVESFDREMPRPLIILIGQQDGTYKFGARSDNVVLCGGCGGVFGDPYEGLTIENGYFSAEHYGGSNWRWTRIITFKYNTEEGKWYLHKDGGDSYHTSNPDKVTSEVLTTKDFGKVLFENYKIED
jgi:hypothetical protein